MNCPRSLKKKFGFTLTELLILAVILGILTAISIASYIKVSEDSKRDLAQSILRTIAYAQRARKQDGRGYLNQSGTLPLAAANSLQKDGYIPAQDWNGYPYDFWVADTSSNPPCILAQATRKLGNSPGTNNPTYKIRALCADSGGNIAAFNNIGALGVPPSGCPLCSTTTTTTITATTTTTVTTTTATTTSTISTTTSITTTTVTTTSTTVILPQCFKKTTKPCQASCVSGSFGTSYATSCNPSPPPPFCVGKPPCTVVTTCNFIGFQATCP